ncbi:hypothetical protein ACRE_022990 [Hapsidospora chrysogenum ATCC 11550]|uniref:Uncharacterized protein n=1 Tax=Hapsidospora chrysogenum (strain ATCC 11550 / CBS 779.69 / DSM 880 / IAM 14645 / JCM 23072 / IMI 49137) TaxID=857340 RepID=A0A086TBV9_HAPC1|nr:hypothetical protein ACRE_022990 [Hapsidospora chrysogenum ATCC 11550]
MPQPDSRLRVVVDTRWRVCDEAAANRMLDELCETILLLSSVSPFSSTTVENPPRLKANCFHEG